MGLRQGEPFLRLTTAAVCCPVASHWTLKSVSKTVASALSLEYGRITVDPWTFPVAGNSLAGVLAKLDDLAGGAEFLLGHNLIEFDLPHLKAVSPNLGLLRLPSVDTLRLNPLAFPRNPYHHLVKHYQDGQLKRGRRNDPELDARLTLEVFANQQKELRDSPADLLTAWHWLTTEEDGAGFDHGIRLNTSGAKTIRRRGA